MERICPKCNMESSISIKLRFDDKSGEYICPHNQAHRFKVGSGGWLESI